MFNHVTHCLHSDWPQVTWSAINIHVTCTVMVCSWITNLCTSKFNYKLLISLLVLVIRKTDLIHLPDSHLCCAHSLLLIDSKLFGSIYCGNAQINADKPMFLKMHCHFFDGFSKLSIFVFFLVDIKQYVINVLITCQY